jgi:hypothetical protein
MPTEFTSPSHRRCAAVRIGVWAVLMLGLAVLALSHYDSFQFGTWKDDATYVVQARALLTPDLRAWLATHGVSASFPPGYPLLLAPLVAIFPGNLLVLRLSSLAATLLCATLLYWGWAWFTPWISHRWVIAVTGLYVMSALTIEHTRMVMSEPVFTVLCLLALLLAERGARRGARWGPDLALGAVLACSVLVRSVGLILVLTVVAYLAIRQGRRWWPSLAATALGMVAVLTLVVALTPASPADIVPVRYLTDWVGSLSSALAHSPPTAVAADPEVNQATLGDQAQRMFAGLILGGLEQRFGIDVDSLVLPAGGGRNETELASAIRMPWLPAVTSYFVSGLVILGFVACFVRKRATAFVVFGPVYLALTLVWESAGGRLLYPILPQLILAFLLGVDAVWRGLTAVVGRQALTTARVPFLILFVVLLGLLSVRESLRLPDTRLFVGDLQARSSWLAANAARSDTLMSPAPAVDSAYTNLRTVAYPAGCPSAEDLTRYLVANQVDFVLVAPDIFWQQEYVPTFSEHTECVANALAGLEIERRAKQVFASKGNDIQVFRVPRD